MNGGRDVRNPIVRTYLGRGRSKQGRPVVRVRIYSTMNNVDSRGTGATIQQAVATALRKIGDK
jgi:hypothetical protein